MVANDDSGRTSHGRPATLNRRRSSGHGHIVKLPGTLALQRINSGVLRIADNCRHAGGGDCGDARTVVLRRCNLRHHNVAVSNRETARHFKQAGFLAASGTTLGVKQEQEELPAEVRRRGKSA